MDNELRFIGRVKSEIKDRSQAPKQEHEGGVTALVQIEPEYREGLNGLSKGDEVLLFTWFHLSDRASLLVHRRGDKSRPRTGVFNTRSPDRPNPVGLHRCRIVDIPGQGELLVHPLEALDQTPIIDIKPPIRTNGQRRDRQGPAIDWGEGVPAELGLDMAETCAKAWAKGLFSGANGNLSVRRNGSVVVTRRGLSKSAIGPGDLVAMDLGTGKRITPGLPSTEVQAHLAVYDAKPETCAILHTHPPRLLAASLALGPDAPIFPPIFEAEIPGKRLQRIEKHPPGSQSLAEAVGKAAAWAEEDCGLLLLEAHGLIAFGQSLDQVLAMSEEAETLAMITMLGLSAAR